MNGADSAIAKPSPALPGAKAERSFYQRIILQALENMTAGCLRLELPDGSRRVIGKSDATVQADIRVKRSAFFKRCVLFGDVGFGEAYMDGEWETDDITAVISWFILNIENAPAMSGSQSRKLLINLLGWQNRILHLLRPNSLGVSPQNIREHYDLGNEFYRLFLDRTMTYSSALFTSPGQSLQDAQKAKYDRLCQQLKLQPGEHLLEIGSGWGGMALHAVKKYGCRVTTITISQAQFDHAKSLFATEGVTDQVEVKLLDYRNVTGKFDKIVSIEMLEAVGDAYLEAYFAKCHGVLKPQGLLGVQMITCPDNRYDSLRRNVDWIQKHIFPGSLLLSVHRINEALRRTGDLCLHDLKEMGLSYAETLRRWRVAFNRELPQVRSQGFDERFVRKWNYYLSYCEAAFAQRNITVVQAVYTRPNNPTLIGR